MGHTKAEVIVRFLILINANLHYVSVSLFTYSPHQPWQEWENALLFHSLCCFGKYRWPFIHGTWRLGSTTVIVQLANRPYTKAQKELENDVSRTNSKVTMCWSIASFRHTSGPRGGVHHLKSGTLNTALEHYFLRGSWWFHFVYTYKVPPLGLQRGATFLSQMRNKLKK